METRVKWADEAAVAEAGALIRAGEVVGFPTETVYGLGANALCQDAVLKIFAAKGRPADNPLIVHVNEPEEIAGLVGEMPQAMEGLSRRLMELFWPGPLTLILPRSRAVPDAVTAGLPNVALRMPSHPVARALIRAAGCPIAAPSANRSGRPSPTCCGHVLEDMQGRIPLILDGGACEVGLESTVLSLTAARPTLLRPGGVTPEMLLPYVPDLCVDRAVLAPLTQGERPASPGMKYKHYSPEASLTVVSGEMGDVEAAMARLYDSAMAGGKRVALLVFEETAQRMGERRCYCLGKQGESRVMASRLFSLLRELDDQGVELAFAQATDTQGLGLALMNRLGRAAGFQTLDAGTFLQKQG